MSKPATSSGVLMYRHRNQTLEVFLVHPGGPFWRARDEGAWSIPKGASSAGEDSLATAIREFREETGFVVSGDFIRLTPVRQRAGKTVEAWAIEGDCDPGQLRSNLFELEWPPRSGKRQKFPEVDRGAWFPIEIARSRINPAQAGLIQELTECLSDG